ncbi:MAG: DEAD/DEAH box helicase [Bacilli bacterium]
MNQDIESSLIGSFGYRSYYDSRSLDMDFLEYSDYTISPKKVELKFYYKKVPLYLTITDKTFSEEAVCTICHSSNCPHLVLGLRYVLDNYDDFKEMLIRADNMYDAKYNSFLFAKLSNNTNSQRKLLNSEIILKYISEANFELIFKIGEKRKYTTKKNIEEFLKVYNNQNDVTELEFGKDLTYSNALYYFNESDTEILDFMTLYVDNQPTSYTRGYYSYYEKVKGIFLKDKSLKQLLEILKDKEFTLEYPDFKILCHGIDTYKLNVSLKKVDENIELELDNNILFVTSDYSYITDTEKLYKVNDEIKSLLQVMKSTNHTKLLFRENEYAKFSNLILPKIKNENLVMDEEIKDKFIIANLEPNFYFDKSGSGIKADIKLISNDIEFNILDEYKTDEKKYFSRDLAKESSYINELTNLGFKLSNNRFKLEDEESIIYFLNVGLKELTLKYPTFVSENIKKISIFQKPKVTSSFSIGRDNILKYDFSVENINNEEITKLLDAIKYKKKYYKLKSGDFMSLENNEDLDGLANIVKDLDMSNKDLLNKNFYLPKYKSIHINSLKDEYGFIEVDKNFEALIDNFNKYKNLSIDLSKKDLDILRDYQETGVKWMTTIAKCGFGGILADEMGLGKSIQTIKYIKLKIKENKEKRLFLIVAPTSLIYNWQEEFNKFGENIKICIINEAKNTRVMKIKSLEDVDVVITTYGLLRQDIDEYKDIIFDTFIIDEAQNIKNLNSGITSVVKEINADTKFALTGTPIENSIFELWSIFDFIMPGFLPNITKFKQIYNNKVIEEGSFGDLNKQISPFILRRKKKEVLKELPDKIENTVIVEMSEEQKKYYVAQLEITKKAIDEASNNNEYMKNQILILSLLTKLRQICIDPHLLIEDYDGPSAKFDAIIDILNGVIANDHKVLLFSQFPSSLKLLMPYLRENNITYSFLDGQTKSKERMNLVDSFNSDKTNVFLISLKAGGTGLNLTAADIVIHLDPWWNPAVENQATDRAHRIGQVNKVEVIKLICKGTIEERIIELQKKKQNLSDNIIEGEDRANIVLSKLSEKELRNILDI